MNRTRATRSTRRMKLSWGSLSMGSVVALASLTGWMGGACTDATGTDGPPATTTTKGLPCDVAKLLESKCTSCHSSPPVAGALVSLVSREDLMAPSAVKPEESIAQRAVERMTAEFSAMPPGGGEAADAPVLQAWIDAGMPEGDCTPIATPDPAFTGASICTSGVTSKLGEDTPNRYDMYPGRACNACHAKGEEGEVIKQFAAAGTVYPTGHEPDDCLGVDGSALPDIVVEVTGADGTVYTARPRKSGNFVIEDVTIALPYTAKIVSSKGERVMSEAQTNGDCNLCHTDEGTSSMGSGVAPGRMVVPY
ncbi:MAG: hypothetical protein U0414_09535 [Polyangiaceae bacterium]